MDNFRPSSFYAGQYGLQARLDHMSGETLLIVEDNQGIRDLLEEDILAPQGFTIFTAADGIAGLDLAERCRPDLILLDMNMPRMSGLEMLASLRKNNQGIPAILMTAYGSESVAIEAFRLGVRDYIVKPFTEEEIREAVDRALNESRLARQSEELNRNLITAEVVRFTVVTLSHYLNNYLTTLKGGLTLMDECLLEKAPDPYLLDILRASQRSALSIQAVMKILLEATSMRLCAYTDSTMMLNIEAALREELGRQPEFADPHGIGTR